MTLTSAQHIVQSHTSSEPHAVDIHKGHARHHHHACKASRQGAIVTTRAQLYEWRSVSQRMSAVLMFMVRVLVLVPPAIMKLPAPANCSAI